MNLEPGMRVRCVDPIKPLVKDCEYTVFCRADSAHADMVKLLGDSEHKYFADRFKPVVRVKAPSIHTGLAATNEFKRRFGESIAATCCNSLSLYRT